MSPSSLSCCEKTKNLEPYDVRIDDLPNGGQEKIFECICKVCSNLVEIKGGSV